MLSVSTPPGPSHPSIRPAAPALITPSYNCRLTATPPVYLFLDTETTGLTPQDRIVSICWALYDATGQHVSTSHHIIYPDGFTIPAAASAVHGISTAMARQKGIPLADALTQLHQHIAGHSPALYVGHNVSFDRPIVLNEYARARRPENLSPLETFCTMKSTTRVCCIPRWNGGYKWPTLEELHRHLFGKAHPSAHDAQADVRACANCFFELLSRGIAPLVVVCPHCRAKNRTKPHAAGQTLLCGACKAPLPT